MEGAMWTKLSFVLCLTVTLSWSSVEAQQPKVRRIGFLFGASPSANTGRIRLELLKEIIPKLSRVAVLGNPGNTATALNFKEAEVAAGAYGLQIQSLEVRGPNDLDSAFSTMTKGRADALLPLGDSVVVFHRERVVSFATKNRLPAMYPNIEWVDAGGLMSYGPDILDNFRRAATYVGLTRRAADEV